jgi:hypothetical protein
MLRTETSSFPSSGVRSHDTGMKNSNRHIMVPVPFGRRGLTSKLFAEWQQRGPETLSGHAVRKLRFTLAPPPSLITANSGG